MFSSIKKIWKYLSARRRKQIWAILFLMIVASLAEVISMGAVIPFLTILTAPERIQDVAIINQVLDWFNLTLVSDQLLWLTIFFSASAFFSGAIRLTLLWAQTRLSQAIGADLDIEIYRRTLHQPYQVHVSRNSSELIAGVSQKASAVVNSMIFPALTIVSSILMVLSILIALLILQPYVALGTFLGFGLIYFCLVYFLRIKLKKVGIEISQMQVRVVKALQEGLGGIRDVLIDGTQEYFCQSFSNANVVLRRASSVTRIIAGAPRFVIEAVAVILIAIVSFILADAESGLIGAIPVLGAFALGAQRILPVLQQIYVSIISLRTGDASVSDAIVLLQQPIMNVDSKALQKLSFSHEIEFKNLDFSYHQNSKFSLSSINFRILKGSRVGIIGTTGSGKSTLVDVLMGLLPATKGELLVDGVPITKFNNRSWQLNIVHVPQSIFLADTSIAENIAFGVPKDEINMKRVVEAATKAQIADSIESWPSRYDTYVGERGVRLSGGQRQRIGIARALYRQATVIVMDEATSALDNQTESSVMDAISQLDPDLTIIIVAHRLSTLRDCTQIVEILDGKVSRVGTFDEIVH